MRIAYCTEERFGYYCGPTNRAMQICTGLRAAGATVEIFSKGSFNRPEEKIIQHKEYGRLNKFRPDIIYLRGSTLIKKIREINPRVPICWEFYPYPFSDSSSDKEWEMQASLYKMVNATTTVGEIYSALVLPKFYPRVEKKLPCCVISPTFDHSMISSSYNKDNQIILSDTISYSHKSQDIGIALGNLDNSTIINISYSKSDKLLADFKKHIGNKTIKYNTPLKTIYKELRSSVTAITLYTQPYCISVDGLKFRDFLGSIRPIEAAINKCIPIVIHSLATYEYFGDLIDEIGIKYVEGDDLASKIVEKTKYILANSESILNKLEKIRFDKYSNLNIGRKLISFLDSVLKGSQNIGDLQFKINDKIKEFAVK